MKKITIKFWTGAAALGLLCQAAPFTVRAQEGKIWEETRETALDVETLFNDSTAPSAYLSFNENEFISEPSPNAPQSSPEMTGQENPKEEEKGNHIYKLDYNKVLEYHIAKRADVTVVCTTCSDPEEVERFGVLRLNDDCRVEEFEEKPMV